MDLKVLGFYDALEELEGYLTVLYYYPFYYDSLSTGKLLKIFVPERKYYYKLFKAYINNNFTIDESKEFAYSEVVNRSIAIKGLEKDVEHTYNQFFRTDDFMVTKNELAKIIKQPLNNIVQHLKSLLKENLIVKTTNSKYKVAELNWKKESYTL